MTSEDLEPYVYRIRAAITSRTVVGGWDRVHMILVNDIVAPLGIECFWDSKKGHPRFKKNVKRRALKLLQEAHYIVSAREALTV